MKIEEITLESFDWGNVHKLAEFEPKEEGLYGVCGSSPSYTKAVAYWTGVQWNMASNYAVWAIRNDAKSICCYNGRFEYFCGVKE